MLGRSRPPRRSPAELERMRAAGRVVAEALAAATEAAVAGATTADLDAVAARVIRQAGATPSFLGYHGYPATLCVSVNDEVVHGIPGARELRDGDLVSIDCGAVVAGWHGDAAVTVGVGAVTPQALALSEATRQALAAGLAQMVPGHRLGDVGAAIETAVAAAGRFAVVDGYVGHGIGEAMHLPPDVPNVGTPGKGLRLEAGMTFAVEPMVTMGTAATRVLADDWTVVTLDGSWAAHWEHTVAVTEDGPWVLTTL